MNYVTIKNGVVSPITERKQLYYKDSSIIYQFNYKSIEKKNIIKYASGNTTNGHYDTTTINGVNIPTNIIPDIDTKKIKEYSLEYKFEFNRGIELDTVNSQNIGLFFGNRTLPDEEGNFYNTKYNVISILKNKALLTLGGSIITIEKDTVDFNSLNNYSFNFYYNENGTVIITTPYNKVTELSLCVLLAVRAIYM